MRELEPDARTTVVDSYDYAALVVSRIASDGYLRMVKTIPQMYRYIYDRAERATEVGRFRTWAHQFTAANLRPLMLRERPHAVVCTHAFPTGAMAAYKRSFADAPPIVAIVTDFAVHGFWIHQNIDRYVVANESLRGALVTRGVALERISASGIPVRPQFARGPEPRDVLRERLDLPRDRSVALLMGGGLGIAPLERMLRALTDVRVPLAAVVVAGRNARIERRLMRAAESVDYPVRALRFVDNVYDYMHAADVLVTKPGGLSTAEALVAQIPMVLCKPLPGQEERNARVLGEAGAALRTRRIEELPAAIETVLSDAVRREHLVAGAKRLGRPAAAHDAAALIAALVKERKEIVA
ncbi:MAG: glycosyltransferase [Candidatus Eremiobacteraeota bacterium]|nr:glycosyltransferase [Candidatus Eremiobacteraeota bacterium]